MPAAAVIPALIAYTKVAAVKKLVVEPWRSYAVGRRAARLGDERFSSPLPPFEDSPSSSLSGGEDSEPLL